MAAPAPAPIAPRLLTAREAAAYLQLPVKTFERLRLGRVALGAAVRYDRFALDAHLDALSGLPPQSGPTPAARAPSADNDDPEAALDRFMARHPDLPRTAARRP